MNVHLCGYIYIRSSEVLLHKYATCKLCKTIYLEIDHRYGTLQWALRTLVDWHPSSYGGLWVGKMAGATSDYPSHRSPHDEFQSATTYGYPMVWILCRWRSHFTGSLVVQLEGEFTRSTLLEVNGSLLSVRICVSWLQSAANQKKNKHNTLEIYWGWLSTRSGTYCQVDLWWLAYAAIHSPLCNFAACYHDIILWDNIHPCSAAYIAIEVTTYSWKGYNQQLGGEYRVRLRAHWKSTACPGGTDGTDMFSKRSTMAHRATWKQCPTTSPEISRLASHCSSNMAILIEGIDHL